MGRLGVGSCLGKRRRRPPSPNGITIGGSRVCTLWSETCPALGTIAPSVATLSAVLTTGWTPENVATPVLQGDGSYLIACNGSGSVAHLLHSPAIGNGISAPAEITFRIRNSVGLIGAWLTLNASASGYFYLDGTSAGSLTVVSTSTDGTWRTFTVRGPATAGAYSTRFAAVKSAGATSFTATTEAYYLQILGYSQIRAASHNNLARADDGSLVDPTGGVQTTIANQPLILDQNGNFYTGASGQIPVLAREAGRVSALVYTDADVVGVPNGDDPAFAVAGICKLSGAGAAPMAWYGAGSSADIPFRINGTNLESHRHDGSTGSTKTLGTNLAASVASWTSFAFLRHADRSCQLYLAGALAATVTHDDLASLTATSFQTGPVTVTTPVQYSLARMAWAGDLTYAAIRPAILAACARYPGLGLVA